MHFTFLHICIIYRRKITSHPYILVAARSYFLLARVSVHFHRNLLLISSTHFLWNKKNSHCVASQSAGGEIFSIFHSCLKCAHCWFSLNNQPFAQTLHGTSRNLSKSMSKLDFPSFCSSAHMICFYWKQQEKENNKTNKMKIFSRVFLLSRWILVRYE